MAGLIISPRARIFHGHDWVYATEIKKTFGNPEPGDVISLKDFKDRALGSAIYNPQSQIVARRFSFRKQDLDLDFFERRFTQALKAREATDINPRLMRLVWSESDALPGIVIDRYGDVLVLQATTLAMHQRLDIIVEAAQNVYQPQGILLRNDSAMLKSEGIEPELKALSGDVPESFVVTQNYGIGDIDYTVQLFSGQKTGLYIDQLQAHDEVAVYAKGRRVLDMFSNQGGFALAAAKAGASAVTAVDISESAVESIAENAKANELSITATKSNAFDYLRTLEELSEEESHDLIILDPPSFTRNKKTVKEALRGYKEIHLRAIKHLKAGGIMSTFCCSHHITQELFLENIVSASVDAKKTIKLIKTHTQRLDHPVLPALPETLYLKGYTFEILASK